MSGLSQKVGYDPVLFAELYGLNVQAEQLAASKPASDQHGEDRVVPFATERIAVRTRQKPFALLGGEPVPERTPIRRTPLTRGIPAASSGLSKPESAAS